jgi:hypothetical protein
MGDDAPMTDTTNHYDRAVAHLDAVDVYVTELRAEYDRPDADRVRVAGLHAAIGRGIKIAETHALLDIGRQVRAVAGML